MSARSAMLSRHRKQQAALMPSGECCKPSVVLLWLVAIFVFTTAGCRPQHPPHTPQPLSTLEIKEANYIYDLVAHVLGGVPRIKVQP